MLLRPLDFFVLLAYFVALICIGLYFAKRKTSADEYFLGDRRINWFLAGASVLATLLSSVSFLAVPGEVIRHGVGLFTENLAFLLVIPVVLTLIIPMLMRLPDTSLYDFLGRRFNQQTRYLATTIFVVMRTVWMGLIIYVCCQAVAAMTGWNLTLLALVVSGITLVYTTLGGIKAVVWSDLMQLVVLAGGALAIPFFIAYQTGAGPVEWWNLFSEANRTSVPLFSLDPTERVTVVGAIVSLFVWHICTHGADQIAAQRYLSTPSLSAAQRSFWFFSIGNMALIGILVLCAVAIFYYEFQERSLAITQFQREIAQEGDQVFPRFIASRLPAGLSGLLLAGILAAAMSSLSAGMNSVGAVLSSAFSDSDDNQSSLSESAKMKLPFLFTMSVGLIAFLIALVVDYFMRTYSWNLITLMNRINHLFVAPMGAMFLGSLWFPRIGILANLLGLLAGILTSVLVSFSGPIFDYELSFTLILPASFLATLGTAISLSYTLPNTTSIAEAAPSQA